jgi:hypothetical protein
MFNARIDGGSTLIGIERRQRNTVVCNLLVGYLLSWLMHWFKLFRLSIYHGTHGAKAIGQPSYD